jgi:hypothetical protein
MSSSDLRELFEACKTGDLVKVKKLLTPQNVNEIGGFHVREALKDLFIVDYALQTRLVDAPLLCISPADMEEKTWLSTSWQMVPILRLATTVD